jgi:hypothetical protein
VKAFIPARPGRVALRPAGDERRAQPGSLRRDHDLERDQTISSTRYRPVLTDCSPMRWHQAVGNETGRQRGGSLACGDDQLARCPSPVSKKDRRLKIGKSAVPPCPRHPARWRVLDLGPELADYSTGFQDRERRIL